MSDFDSFKGESVHVGVLETKFCLDIPDIKGSNIRWCDFTKGNNKLPYNYDHGTNSVSCLVAQGNSKLIGIAPRIILNVALVVDNDGYANPYIINQALSWLIKLNCDIICIPLGEPIERELIRNIIIQGKQKGIIFVAAAGNAFPQEVLFPANLDETISVGACDKNGDLLSECCRKPSLDIVAPGSEIPVLNSTGIITKVRGTSIASIITTGVLSIAISAGYNLPTRLKK